MRQPVRGGQSQLQRCRIGHAAASRLEGWIFISLDRTSICAAAPWTRRPNAQGTEHRDIEENIGKFSLVTMAHPRDHEDLFPKAWDVLQDGSQVGQFHLFLIQIDSLHVG